jgi:hypothetical protein
VTEFVTSFRTICLALIVVSLTALVAALTPVPEAYTRAIAQRDLAQKLAGVIRGNWVPDYLKGQITNDKKVAKF